MAEEDMEDSDARMLAKINALTDMIIGAAMQVHSALGPGLLESAYEVCLTYELVERGLTVEIQKPVPVRYKGVELDCAYRLDLLVSDLVVVAVKAVQAIEPVHQAQLLSYLKLAHKPAELLINFHVPSLRQGIKRIRL